MPENLTDCLEYDFEIVLLNGPVISPFGSRRCPKQPNSVGTPLAQEVRAVQHSRDMISDSAHGLNARRAVRQGNIGDRVLVGPVIATQCVQQEERLSNIPVQLHHEMLGSMQRDDASGRRNNAPRQTAGFGQPFNLGECHWSLCEEGLGYTSFD